MQKLNINELTNFLNTFHLRYNSNVIRLANNNLIDTTGLYQMALDVVEFPEDIAWLDLSFNEINDVSDDILEFPGTYSVITIYK